MIILIGIALTYTLYNAFYKWIDKGWLPNSEPFNCSFCISFWISLYLAVGFQNEYALLIPICNKIVERLMNRL